jgi:hypothetical protein
MLLFIAFVLFAVLFVAWLAAPTGERVAKPATAPDGMMPEPRTSVA